MTDARRQLDALTGLRGVAALWVLLFHMQTLLQQASPASRALGFLTGAGYLGVDLFFALSGFVIAHACSAELSAGPSAASWWRFMQRRFARIYPVHLAVIALLALAIGASRAIGRDFAAGGEYGVVDLLRHLTLTHVWLPGGAPSWNTPSWSIHAEWFAYAAFPWFAGALLRARDPRRLLLGVAACYVALVAVVELALAGNYDRTHDYGVLRVIAGFSAGAMLWRAWTLGALDGVWLRRLASAWPLVVIGALAIDRGHGLALPIVAMSVPAAVIGRGAFARLLASRPLQYLGRVSYSLYMIHAIALIQLEARLPVDALPGALPRLLLLAGYVGVVLACAHAMYRWIEEPARALLIRRRAAAAAVTP